MSSPCHQVISSHAVYCLCMIYKIMHELLWITIFWSQVRWFGNDFPAWRSHEWKSLANHIWSDQKKSLFIVTNVLFYFLHAILCPETQFLWKQSDVTHFEIVVKDSFFWLSIVTSPRLICDVKWTQSTGTVTSYFDCSCTCKLSQRRSSLVNNNREYRFLTTR